MTGTCRFLGDRETTYVIGGREHSARLIEITFTNGIKFPILATSGPDWREGSTVAWHYEVKDTGMGKRITLTARPTNSVKVLDADGKELAHETITDWPLTE